MNNLVDIEPIIPYIQLDMRYATTNNFIGEQLYDVAKAYLVTDAAKALRAASQDFATLGLGILVWDAYRPLSVTELFWQRTPPELQSFLGNPKNGGSPHNRGCAIDLTLYNLTTSAQLEMPSDFDEFTERAKMDYLPASATALSNRENLRLIMESHGFVVRPDEWWHYDWKSYLEYPVLDIPIP